MFNQNQREAIMKLKNITMEHFMKLNRKLMKIMKDVVEKKDEFLDGKWLNIFINNNKTKSYQSHDKNNRDNQGLDYQSNYQLHVNNRKRQ